MGHPPYGNALTSLTAGHEPSSNKSHTMASLILREAVEQTGATLETIVTNDVAVAFAALQVELTSLLGRIPELRANEELREDNHESRHQTQLDVITGKADDLREA